jgi:hypothetical protein
MVRRLRNIKSTKRLLQARSKHNSDKGLIDHDQFRISSACGLIAVLKEESMRVCLALGMLLAMVATANAQTTVVGTVTLIRTGWNSDSFGIMVNAPQANPANCTVRDQGYVTDSSLPGYHTYYAAALTAYLSKKPIHVVVHNTECQGGRTYPKLIGINLPM